MHVMTARLQRLLHQMRHALDTPSRNPRMTVVVGRLLGAAFLVCFATGVISHFHQDPLPWLVFPTRPVWIYALTQGIHVTAGIACIPLLLAKLYAVFPELFQTPVTSVVHAIERASIALFVSASLVQLAIGLLNTYQLYSLFGFSFRLTHYALSYVIIGSLAIHIGVKLPIIARYWSRASATLADEVPPTADDRDDPAAGADELQRLTGRPATAGVTGRLFAWIDRTPPPREPGPATRTSRRAFLTSLGVAVGSVTALTVGQSLRAFDALNVFAPRVAGVGPQRLPVNRTARAAGVTSEAVGPGWRLTIANGSRVETFDRARLAALDQHDEVLPIACVEGWNQAARWRGPRLRDLLDAVGADPQASVRITSLQQRGSFGVTLMQPEFVRDPLTLVALQLEGEDLDIDHGYPARIIAPARPGVLQTKWLSSIEVIA